MGNFKSKFLGRVMAALNDKKIKEGTDYDKLSIGLVDTLKRQLNGHYPDAQFRCEIEQSRIIIIGDESPAQNDGHIIEYTIKEDGELVFVPAKEG